MNFIISFYSRPGLQAQNGRCGQRSGQKNPSRYRSFYQKQTIWGCHYWLCFPLLYFWKKLRYRKWFFWPERCSRRPFWAFIFLSVRVNLRNTLGCETTCTCFKWLNIYFPSLFLGLGCKLKMDDVGNVLVKRITRGTAVSIKNTTEESAVSNDILKLSNGVLSPDQPYKVRVPTELTMGSK